MANVADVYPPEMWAEEALIVLENEKVVANLVHRNFENVIASQGDTVHTRSRDLIPLQSKVNDGSALTFANPQADDVIITLRYHEVAAFLLTDRDFQTSIQSLVEDFVQPALIPISQRVDDLLLQGDLGNFADGEGLLSDDVLGPPLQSITSMTQVELATVRAAMRANQVPLSPGSVHLVLGPQHEGEALQQEIFVRGDARSEPMPPIVTGFINRVLGFNVWASQNAVSNSDTSGSGLASSSAFHPNAMTLLTRPLEEPPRDLGIRSSNVEKDGLSIRAVISWDHDALSWKISYDLLFGFRLINRLLALRVQG